MKTIYKYQLNTGDNWLMLPKNSEVIHVGEQHGAIMIWVLLDHSQQEMRHFHVYGTGFTMPDNPGKHLGTVTHVNGEFVWHVFENPS